VIEVRLVEFKHGEDTGHLVEVAFSLAEALLQFCVRCSPFWNCSAGTARH